eukprot:3509355-Alexandrium_andersonii.AAC.1
MQPRITAFQCSQLQIILHRAPECRAAWPHGAWLAAALMRFRLRVFVTHLCNVGARRVAARLPRVRVLPAR